MPRRDRPTHRIRAVIRQDLRHHRTDPTPLIVLTAMPLMLMAFIKPAVRAEVAGDYGGAALGVPVNGAEQAVPGMAVMFSFFLVTNVGYTVFREHGWQTWDRLRVSVLRPAELVAGRVATMLLVALAQLAVLFGVGGLLYGLRVRGSYLGLAAVAAALALCMVCFGLALVALCRTMMQVNAVANLSALLFAGLGGALTPVSALPAWARPVAPASPSFWAMRGFRAVLLDGAGPAGVLVPVAVLLGFSGLLVTVGAMFFRFDDEKASWT
jgi:ABC-2 type transport system permease protein